MNKMIDLKVSIATLKSLLKINKNEELFKFNKIFVHKNSYILGNDYPSNISIIRKMKLTLLNNHAENIYIDNLNYQSKNQFQENKAKLLMIDLLDELFPTMKIKNCNYEFYDCFKKVFNNYEINNPFEYDNLEKRIIKMMNQLIEIYGINNIIVLRLFLPYTFEYKDQLLPISILHGKYDQIDEKYKITYLNKANQLLEKIYNIIEDYYEITFIDLPFSDYHHAATSEEMSFSEDMSELLRDVMLNNFKNSVNYDENLKILNNFYQYDEQEYTNCIHPEVNFITGSNTIFNYLYEFELNNCKHVEEHIYTETKKGIFLYVNDELHTKILYDYEQNRYFIYLLDSTKQFDWCFTINPDGSYKLNNKWKFKELRDEFIVYNGIKQPIFKVIKQNKYNIFYVFNNNMMIYRLEMSKGNIEDLLYLKDKIKKFRLRSSKMYYLHLFDTIYYYDNSGMLYKEDEYDINKRLIQETKYFKNIKLINIFDNHQKIMKKIQYHNNVLQFIEDYLDGYLISKLSHNKTDYQLEYVDYENQKIRLYERKEKSEYSYVRDLKI